MEYTPRILIVDDSPSVRQAIISNFKDRNIDFVEASNAYVAIEVIEKSENFAEPVDLIITDITMPGINGLDLVKEKNSNDLLPYIPVLIMTSFSEENPHISETWSLNITDVIQKPFKTGELRSKVFSVLNALTNCSSASENNSLVISGSTFQREFFKKILLQCNSKVVDTVGQFSEGSSKVFSNLDNNNAYDLIITDWQIGTTDCHNFISEIRSREELADVPICVTMSSFKPSILSQLMSYQLLTVLNKNISKEDLGFKIKYLSHLKDLFSKENKTEP